MLNPLHEKLALHVKLAITVVQGKWDRSGVCLGVCVCVQVCVCVRIYLCRPYACTYACMHECMFECLKAICHNNNGGCEEALLSC